MEGVYTHAVTAAIAVLIVLIVGSRPGKLTALIAALLYITAVAIWFIPLFPATVAKTDIYDERMTVIQWIIAGAVIAIFLVACWLVWLHDICDDVEAIMYSTVIALLAVLGAVWVGVKTVHSVTHYSPYKNNDWTYATKWTAEPTGVETVIYENDKGVTVQMKTEYGWTDISTIEDESALVYGHKFRVTKDGEYVDIPSTGVDFVETSGLLTGDYKSIAKVRVTKVKLIERLHKEVLLANPNYIRRQNTSNKVVVEYEVINADEVKQHLSEDEQREQKKAQTKEQLQQFITPPKGD